MAQVLCSPGRTCGSTSTRGSSFRLAASVSPLGEEGAGLGPPGSGARPRLRAVRSAPRPLPDSPTRARPPGAPSRPPAPRRPYTDSGPPVPFRRTRLSSPARLSVRRWAYPKPSPSPGPRTPLAGVVARLPGRRRAPPCSRPGGTRSGGPVSSRPGEKSTSGGRDARAGTRAAPLPGSRGLVSLEPGSWGLAWACARWAEPGSGPGGPRPGGGMAKAPTPRRAPGDRLAEPGLGKQLARKKSRKRKFWKSRGRDASKTPGSGPGDVVVRPPKAPEDFSQNWRALQQVGSEGPLGRHVGVPDLSRAHQPVEVDSEPAGT